MLKGSRYGKGNYGQDALNTQLKVRKRERTPYAKVSAAPKAGVSKAAGAKAAAAKAHSTKAQSTTTQSTKTIPAAKATSKKISLDAIKDRIAAFYKKIPAGKRQKEYKRSLKSSERKAGRKGATGVKKKKKNSHRRRIACLPSGAKSLKASAEANSCHCHMISALALTFQNRQ